jgi:phospholipid/cholesterol/gamma-HCH transport system substrate-binding protein
LKISRELKTGVIAIGIIVLFIWGYNFLKDQSVYDSIRTFYVEYSNVQGLKQNSEVTINGLAIGKVSNIYFHPSRTGKLLVQLDVTNNIEFSTNSVTKIYSPGLISPMAIKIVMANDGAVIAKNKDTLQGEIDLGILGTIDDQIGPLKTKLESFVSNTDSLILDFSNLLDAENQRNLKLSIKNFKNLSYKVDEILENNKEMVDSLLIHTNTSMRNLSEMTDSLKKADLAATVIKLQTTLDSFNSVLDSIQSGNGSIGKLMNDDALYNNLEAASKELEELLNDFKLHPKRYVNVSVFGKKAKEYEEKTDE